MKYILIILAVLFPLVNVSAHPAKEEWFYHVHAEKKQANAQSSGSLVCVHGFFRSSRCMLSLRNAFSQEGMTVYLWDYQGRKQNIEEHGAALVTLLKKIALEKPGEPIHFATHSLGGVIVRTAVNHPDCPREAKIGKAVLLAPPNRGSQLARHFHDATLVHWLFGKKAGHQLLTFDAEAMESLGTFPDEVKVMVIAGNKESPFFRRWLSEPNDGKVTVEETRLSTPHTHHVLPVSHRWIMTSRTVIAMSKQFILTPN